jgi:hypothetical protein
VRRQLDPWARTATVAFQRGDVAAAVKAYDANGAFAFVPDRVAAVTAVADAVMASGDQFNRSAKPATQIVLAHRNDDILALNTVIHERRAAAGLLGPDVAVATAKGDRMMAPVVVSEKRRSSDRDRSEIGPEIRRDRAGVEQRPRHNHCDQRWRFRQRRGDRPGSDGGHRRRQDRHV